MAMNNPIEPTERERIAIEVSKRASLLIQLTDVAKVQNENIDRLTVNIKDLAEAVKKRPTFKQVIGALIFFVVIALTFLGGLIYLGYGNHQNGVTLISCTTPHHKCYDNAQKNTADKIQQILNASKNDRCAEERFVSTIAKFNNLKSIPLDSDCTTS